jgi:hypothetical protein
MLCCHTGSCSATQVSKPEYVQSAGGLHHYALCSTFLYLMLRCLLCLGATEMKLNLTSLLWLE